MSSAYKNSGVDIQAGYDAVNRIKKHMRKTFTPGVLGDVGSFGGLYSLAGINMKKPVLVSGTDGVGTKLQLAHWMGVHTTIGIDAVAMCANDIVSMGAQPLFFLDYIACGKLVPEVMEDIITGICEGCKQAGCALIGGEMAEHPGMMEESEYDIAGFCVGIVEKNEIITGKTIAEGDTVIGLLSSGLHSNGFSLVRKIIKENNLSLNTDFVSSTLGDTLLTPTKMYVKPILELAKAIPPKGIANITGGGFMENIPRILPDGLAAVIDTSSWEVPPIFEFLRHKGGVGYNEMFNIFNMGIGMVLVTSKENAEETVNMLGGDAIRIGQIEKGSGVILG